MLPCTVFNVDKEAWSERVWNPQH